MESVILTIDHSEINREGGISKTRWEEREGARVRRTIDRPTVVSLKKQCTEYQA